MTPIAARTASGARPLRARRTSPASARINVDGMFMVVFPARFGPSSEKTVPSGTSRSMPSRTTAAETCFRRRAARHKPPVPGGALTCWSR